MVLTNKLPKQNEYSICANKRNVSRKLHAVQVWTMLASSSVYSLQKFPNAPRTASFACNWVSVVSVNIKMPSCWLKKKIVVQIHDITIKLVKNRVADDRVADDRVAEDRVAEDRVAERF